MPTCGAIPGLFFCFAASVLLVFVSVSSPTWESVHFLEVGAARAGRTRFGVFGYTNSDTAIGYRNLRPLTRVGLSSDDIDRVENLSSALILHPIAAGLGGIAILFGMCGANYHRSGTVSMMLFAGLATLVTLAAWVIDMVLFIVLREKFRDVNISSELGNALWLTLAAFVAFVLGFIFSFCGICGRYSKKDQKRLITRSRNSTTPSIPPGGAPA